MDVAVEAYTGWLFVSDALVAAGAVAHLAEPVETRASRGRKRRAKTDREDAKCCANCSPKAAAGGVDPARACAPVAFASADAPHADRRTHAMAAAHPGDAVPSRHHRHSGAAAHPRRPSVPRGSAVARRRARADRDRVGDDRRHRCPDRPLERNCASSRVQSCSRCVSQLAALTIGGPVAVAGPREARCRARCRTGSPAAHAGPTRHAAHGGVSPGERRTRA
jgi:hypothetical protein